MKNLFEYVRPMMTMWNSRGRRLGIALLCLVAGFKANVQTRAAEKPPLSAGPLVAKAPATSTLQIVFTYSGEKPAPGVIGKPAAGQPGASTPRQITVIRTPPLWYAVQVDCGGKTSECWCKGESHFVRLAGQKTPTAMGSDSAVLAPLLVKNDNDNFPDVAWVSPASYIGTQQFGGRLCFVFQESGSDGAMVWIDAASRYPVQWRKSGEVRTFSFLAAPTEKISLPPDLAKVCDEMDRIREIGRLQAQ